MVPIICTGLQPTADLLKEVTLKSNLLYQLWITINPSTTTTAVASGNITFNGRDGNHVNH